MTVEDFLNKIQSIPKDSDIYIVFDGGNAISKADSISIERVKEDFWLSMGSKSEYAVLIQGDTL